MQPTSSSVAVFLLLALAPPNVEAFSSCSMRTSASATATLGTPLSAMSGSDAVDVLDRNAFDKKNAIRRKFGLAALTETEFVQLQEQVSQMERECLEKERQQQQQAAATTKASSSMKKKDLLSTVFGTVLESTCQDNFDCESPQVCCDFVLKKMCCSSGEQSRNVWQQSVGAQSQLQPILLPVPVSNGEY